MSKVILLVFVVLFATTNATILSDLVEGLVNTGQEVVQSVRYQCNEAGHRRIEAEKDFINRKYEWLERLRETIGADHHDILKTVYDRTLTKAKRVKEQVNRKIENCQKNYPGKECTKCQAKTDSIMAAMNDIVENMNICRQEAENNKKALVDEIKDVKSQATSALERLDNLLTNTCVESIMVRMQAAVTTIVSSVRLSHLSVRLSLEQRQRRAKSTFNTCIRSYGHDELVTNENRLLNVVQECIDNIDMMK